MTAETLDRRGPRAVHRGVTPCFLDVVLLSTTFITACATPRAADTESSIDASPHGSGQQAAGTSTGGARQYQSTMTSPKRGILLEDLTWCEAEKVLTPDTIVVIPIGAESKEHGPHLELRNDFLLAQHFKERVLESADVVVAPTVNYHYYPAFLEYPGSTSLRLETARDLMVDICKSLAGYGPRRFYALNTGVSTIRALAPAAEILAADGILLTYTNLDCMAPIEKEVCRQEAGSHADEVETSMMLVIAPNTVDMSKAVKDCSPKGTSGLSRDPSSTKTYSPTGTWGDPTLATHAKGEKLVAALTKILLEEIEALRGAPLPGKSNIVR